MTPEAYRPTHTTGIPDKAHFPRHMHNGYELLYFVRGDAEYVIEGEVFRMHPRDLLFIPPRKFHYLKPQSDAVYERFILQFPEEMIPVALLDFAASGDAITRVPEDSPIARYFELWRAAEQICTKEELRIFLANAPATLLLFLSHLQGAPAKPVRRNKTLAEILAYIDAHPTVAHTADSLAATFFVSTSYLVHTFRRELGITPRQYIEKKRILFAEARIRAGERPTDVAALCGYDSYSTFWRQYKRVLGHPPAEND